MLPGPRRMDSWHLDIHMFLKREKNISKLSLRKLTLVILHAFLSSADFFQNQLFQKILRNTIRVSNSLNRLGPDCLQKLLAHDKASR